MFYIYNFVFHKKGEIVDSLKAYRPILFWWNPKLIKALGQVKSLVERYIYTDLLAYKLWTEKIHEP